jgi:hypothetical protein
MALPSSFQSLSEDLTEVVGFCVGQLLMPVFPGQMRYVRKNLFHAVYVIDPATPKGLMASDFSLVIDTFCVCCYIHVLCKTRNRFGRLCCSEASPFSSG